MEFSKYLHAVGTGPKGNRDLTHEEAKDMMTQILNQSVPTEQISAFLLGWRLKPETNDEFRGALEACDAKMKVKKIENSLELGYPFDGKRRNPYIFPLVSKVLEQAGVSLVVIGDELQPAKDGITTKQICNKLDLSDNLHFFDRKDFFKEMHDLTDLRMTLTLRTGFNTIEKLPGIASSSAAITGVFHKPYVKKYVEIYKDRYERFALIQGNEGTPELFSKGRLWINQNDTLEEILVDPNFYGIKYTKSWDEISLEESLEQVTSPSDDYMKLAKLNAAVYMFVLGKSKSIEEAFEILG